MAPSTRYPTHPRAFNGFDWLAALDTVSHQRGGPPLPAVKANVEV
jgi:hypothetical protein